MKTEDLMLVLKALITEKVHDTTTPYLRIELFDDGSGSVSFIDGYTARAIALQSFNSAKELEEIIDTLKEPIRHITPAMNWLQKYK